MLPLFLYWSREIKMKNVCLIDLDDTLGDLKTPMMEALNRETGKNVHWSKWRNFNVPEIYDISEQKFLNICIDYNVLEQVIIHDTSYDFLKNLQMLNYHTVLVTARNWHPRGVSITENWVADHNLCIDDIIVVDVDQSKVSAIGHLKNIVFTIDDRMKHCREYIKSGLVEHTLVYDAPWNSHMTKWNTDWNGYDYDERIYDLHEIIEHVEWNKYDKRIMGNVR